MKISLLPDISGISRDSVRPLLFMVLAFLLWVISFYVWSGISNLESKSKLNYARFEELTEVVRSYKNLPHREDRSSAPEDPMVVVSSLVESMGLKDNLIQISSLSKGVSVQLSRLYSEKTLSFIQELGKRGLSIESAEVRAVPEGAFRLLSISLIITVSQQ
ncbi:hypothetical protein L2W58_02960 [Dethiosulfovibrio sp. F2B]|uniref:type II secretion system protein GspM n=1 Tax=Dethiosulfovibrio faecalis TaxID=2720018 RepID=UPI001F35BE2F|nr:type II secretion system protein GspM [Dethiosulfovibrio faecalis]MCF4150751.1 hypothetical protein [Dethiosulfovibrio faecalis]